MEPLAPGTEDDPLYTQVNKPSKKETAEEHALSKKAFLANGKYGNIFELNYIQGAQHWFCKVCDCPVLGRLFNHEIGKRHTGNLEKFNKNIIVGGKDSGATHSVSSGADAPILVAPGEPLPPGFEGEVEKVTMIQERLDGFNVGPLLGLEYLLELLDYDPSKEPFYLCILCDKKGDPRTVLTHLSSYNHLLMYLQKHFPTVYRHIAPFMIKPYKRNWQAGLQKIAEAIENTFGRLKPMPVEAGKFERDRMHYIEIVAKGKHFSELSGHTFENVVSKEELTKIHEETKPYDSNLPFRKAVQQTLPKRKSPSPPVVARPMMKKLKPNVEKLKKAMSPVSDISSSDLEDYDPHNTPKTPKQLRSNTGNFGRRERSPVRRRSPSPKRRDGPMPWQKSNYGRSKPVAAEERKRDDKMEKIEEYKKLSKAIENDMDQVLKKHKQNPEKHPKYNDEWKKFWNKRYKELQAEGNNPSTHDFKPEWIEFWNKRMHELHQEEIKTKKTALRKRLGLPEEPTPISFKIGERRKPSESGSRDNKPIPTAAQPDSDPEVIIIDDNDKDSTRSRSSSRRRNRSRSPVRKVERSAAQFRRRSPLSHRESPLSRRKDSPVVRRRESPSRRPSPLDRRDSMSPMRKKGGDKSREPKLSPPPMRITPPSRRDREAGKYSPVKRYSSERSPGPDRFRKRSSDRSNEHSKSIGRSREVSWEGERDRYRDYDDKTWDRPYRMRDAPRGMKPWDDCYPHVENPYAPPKVLRDVTRAPVKGPPKDEDDNEEVNIVGVLRLLTALEERLGSLGPKVIELLGQALAMEKKVANSSEELLDSEINCVLFETVKEKLKGQLQAELVNRAQEKAFKIAIKKTASLIHMAGQRKKQREVELPKKPVIVPGIGTVDQGKIARQIANALIAEGKTDVTQDELEQLIHAVVGIAEAQKTSSQPLTTARFLENLRQSTSTDEKNLVQPESKPETQEKSKVTSEKIEEEQDNSSGSVEKSMINMEGLSDSDLQTLLQNFKDLSTDEQHGLINYLKKLEAKEPERVEKLRKFVNLNENLEEKTESGRYSPFSNRLGSVNPASKDSTAAHKDEGKKVEKASNFVNIDSEEEDYSFEDVAKAASQKVIQKELEQKRKEEETKRENDDKNMNDAKALITSLMSSLNKNVTNISTNSTAPIAVEPKVSPTSKINIISNIPVSTSDLAKSLSGITMSVSSLGSILGNVQNLTRQNQADQILTNQNKTDPQETRTTPESINKYPYQMPNPSHTKNPYNEFDIGSPRRGKSDLDTNDVDRGRLNKPYDEFNIGPNIGDFRETSRDLGRDTGFEPNRGVFGPSLLNKSSGFPDRDTFSKNLPPQDRMVPPDRNLPPQDRMVLPERNLPFSNVGGVGYRPNSTQRDPSPPIPNQFQPRLGIWGINTRPGAGGFDTRGGPSDYTNDRDFRGSLNEPRRDFRGGLGDTRGGPSVDFRGGVGDSRSGPLGDFRGGMNDIRGDFRGNSDDYREASDNFRGGSDFRSGPNDFRGTDYRNDFRNDMRSDSKSTPGIFRGGSDDSRGGSLPNRAGPTDKSGFLIDPNRLGNPAAPRFGGNYAGNSGFKNSHKRW